MKGSGKKGKKKTSGPVSPRSSTTAVATLGGPREKRKSGSYALGSFVSPGSTISREGGVYFSSASPSLGSSGTTSLGARDGYSGGKRTVKVNFDVVIKAVSGLGASHEKNFVVVEWKRGSKKANRGETKPAEVVDGVAKWSDERSGGGRGEEGSGKEEEGEASGNAFSLEATLVEHEKLKKFDEKEIEFVIKQVSGKKKTKLHKVEVDLGMYATNGTSVVKELPLLKESGHRRKGGSFGAAASLTVQFKARWLMINKKMLVRKYGHDSKGDEGSELTEEYDLLSVNESDTEDDASVTESDFESDSDFDELYEDSFSEKEDEDTGTKKKDRPKRKQKDKKVEVSEKKDKVVEAGEKKEEEKPKDVVVAEKPEEDVAKLKHELKRLKKKYKSAVSEKRAQKKLLEKASTEAKEKDLLILQLKQSNARQPEGAGEKSDGDVKMKDLEAKLEEQSKLTQSLREQLAGKDRELQDRNSELRKKERELRQALAKNDEPVALEEGAKRSEERQSATETEQDSEDPKGSDEDEALKKRCDAVSAFYDFNARNDKEMSFKKGDILYITDKDPFESGMPMSSEWWRAVAFTKAGPSAPPTKVEGLIPVNYVKIIRAGVKESNIKLSSKRTESIRKLQEMCGFLGGKKPETLESIAEEAEEAADEDQQARTKKEQFLAKLNANLGQKMWPGAAAVRPNTATTKRSDEVAAASTSESQATGDRLHSYTQDRPRQTGKRLPSTIRRRTKSAIVERPIVRKGQESSKDAESVDANGREEDESEQGANLAELESEMNILRDEVKGLLDSIETVSKERDSLQAAVEELKATAAQVPVGENKDELVASLRRELASKTAELLSVQNIQKEKDEMEKELDQMKEEIKLLEEMGKALESKESLLNDIVKYETEKDVLVKELQRMEQEKAEFATELEKMRHEKESESSRAERVRHEMHEMAQQKSKLMEEKESLALEVESLMKETQEQRKHHEEHSRSLHEKEQHTVGILAELDQVKQEKHKLEQDMIELQSKLKDQLTELKGMKQQMEQELEAIQKKHRQELEMKDQELRLESEMRAAAQAGATESERKEAIEILVAQHARERAEATKEVEEQTKLKEEAIQRLQKEEREKMQKEEQLLSLNTQLAELEAKMEAERKAKDEIAAAKEELAKLHESLAVQFAEKNTQLEQESKAKGELQTKLQQAEEKRQAIEKDLETLREEHQAKEKQLEEEKQTTETRAVGLHSEMDDLKAKIAQEEKLRASAVAEVDELKARQQTMQETIDKINGETTRLQEELTEATKQKDTATKELEALRAEHTAKEQQLKEEKEQTDTRAAGLHTEMDELKAKIAQEEKLRASAVAEVDELKARQQTMQESIDKTNEEVSRLQGELAEATKQKDSTLKELETLRTEHIAKEQQLKEEKEQTNSRAAGLHTEMDELKAKIAQEEKLRASAVAEVDEIKARQQTMQETIDKTNEEVSRLQGELSEATKQKEDLTKDLEELRAEYQSKEKQLEGERQKTETRAAGLHTEMDELKATIANEEKLKASALAEVDELRSRQQTLQETVNKTNEDVSRLQRELSEATKQKDSATKDLEELKKKFDADRQKHEEEKANLEQRITKEEASVTAATVQIAQLKKEFDETNFKHKEEKRALQAQVEKEAKMRDATAKAQEGSQQKEMEDLITKHMEEKGQLEHRIQEQEQLRCEAERLAQEQKEADQHLVEKLRQEIASKGKEITEKNKECETLAREKAQEAEARSAAEETNQQTVVKLSELMNALQLLNAKIETLNDEKVQALHEAERMSITIEELQQKLHAEETKASQNLQENDVEKEQLRQSVADLGRQLKALQGRDREHEKDRTNLQAAVLALQGETKSAKEAGEAQKREMQKMIETLEQQVKELQGRVNESNAECEKLRATVVGFETKAVEEGRRRVLSEQESGKVKEAAIAAETQLQAVRTQLAASEKKLSDMSKAMGEKEKEWEAKRQELQQRLEESTQNYQRLEKQMADQSKERERLVAELSKFEAQQEDDKKTLASLEAAILENEQLMRAENEKRSGTERQLEAEAIKLRKQVQEAAEQRKELEKKLKAKAKRDKEDEEDRASAADLKRELKMRDIIDLTVYNCDLESYTKTHRSSVESTGGDGDGTPSRTRRGSGASVATAHSIPFRPSSSPSSDARKRVEEDMLPAGALELFEHLLAVQAFGQSPGSSTVTGNVPVADSEESRNPAHRKFINSVSQAIRSCIARAAGNSDHLSFWMSYVCSLVHLSKQPQFAEFVQAQSPASQVRDPRSNGVTLTVNSTSALTSSHKSAPGASTSPSPPASPSLEHEDNPREKLRRFFEKMPRGGKENNYSLWVRQLQLLQLDVYGRLLQALQSSLQPVLIPAVLEHQTDTVLDSPQLLSHAKGHAKSASVSHVSPGPSPKGHLDKVRRTSPDQLVRILSSFYSAMRKRRVYATVVRQVVEEALWWSNATVFNALLQRNELCTAANGFQIKHALSYILDWVLSQSVLDPDRAKAQLQHLEGAANVLAIDKRSFANEQAVQAICPALNPVQVLHLLAAFHTDEVSSEAVPNESLAVVRKVAAREGKRPQPRGALALTLDPDSVPSRETIAS